MTSETYVVQKEHDSWKLNTEQLKKKLPSIYTHGFQSSFVGAIIKCF